MAVKADVIGTPGMVRGERYATAGSMAEQAVLVFIQRMGYPGRLRETYRRRWRYRRRCLALLAEKVSSDIVYLFRAEFIFKGWHRGPRQDRTWVPRKGLQETQGPAVADVGKFGTNGNTLAIKLMTTGTVLGEQCRGIG
jgi:hypothetical protein